MEIKSVDLILKYQNNLYNYYYLTQHKNKKVKKNPQNYNKNQHDYVDK